MDHHLIHPSLLFQKIEMEVVDDVGSFQKGGNLRNRSDQDRVKPLSEMILFFGLYKVHF